MKAKYNELGEKMVVFRARNRLSQADLAKMCGCSLQTINSVLNQYDKMYAGFNLTK